MDAGFLNVVRVGQYFMTKDTAEFSQFTDAVACHEYTLPRDEEASQPKGWIQGNTKIGPVLEIATCCLHGSEPKGWIRGNTTIGPVLEVATSYLHGKYVVEIRIMSVNKDNSHSWVRISHGLNNLVTKLNNNAQETSEVQFEENALKIECE